MTIYSKIAMFAVGTALIVTSAVADARPTRAKVKGPNGSITAVTGEKGSVVSTRGGQKNEDGSVSTASGAAFEGANGARGGRASTTTVNPDGSANRRSSASASGVNGSAATSSDVTRNADGTYSGGRTSTATNNTTGNSYNGSTQIDPATGKPVRTASCTDAAGNAVACPR